MSKILVLQKKYATLNQLDFSVILAHCLRRKKEFIYTHPEYRLTIIETLRLKRALSLYRHGCPIAYITGHKEFFGLDFFVNRHTLIPRPETEMLVEEILKNTPAQGGSACPPASGGGGKTIADIGTGSGCIAITLAKQNPMLVVYASDISNSALKVARKNSNTHQTKINFLHGDILTPFKNISLDAIVANFPYVDIAEKNKPTTPFTKGLKFEPQSALYAADHGMAIFKKFFAQLSQLSSAPQYIYLEIGADQGEAIKQIALSHFPGVRIEIKKDFCGRDRVAVIEIK